jgi:transposase-like protein
MAMRYTVEYHGRPHVVEIATDFLIIRPPVRATLLPRTPISEQLRTAVWVREFGEASVAKCPVCKLSDLSSPAGFQCGHIVAHAEGGKETIENLRPVCRDCNLGMRTANMTEFIRSLRSPARAADKINSVLRRMTWSKKYGLDARGSCKCGEIDMDNAIYEKIKPDRGWYIGNIKIRCPKCESQQPIKSLDRVVDKAVRTLSKPRRAHPEVLAETNRLAKELKIEIDTVEGKHERHKLYLRLLRKAEKVQSAFIQNSD